MQTSVEVAEIAKALAVAQKNFAPIPKDREVTVMSQKGSYKFKYATLDAIRNATLPALSEQGIAVVQGLTEDGHGLETTLFHSSGQWIKGTTPMIVSGRRDRDTGREFPPTNQELGSAQSYARRYGLSALLCVTADEDDDGNIADGNHIEKTDRVPYKPRQSSENGRRMASDDQHLVDQNRQKGTMAAGNGDALRLEPHQKPEKKLSAAEEKVKTWNAQAIGTLNLSEQSKDSLASFWKENSTKIEWMEQNMSTEYEKLLSVFDLAMERAAARAS